MINFLKKSRSTFVSSRLFILLIVILLGIFFRIVNLDRVSAALSDRKIFWVDEVATSIRLSGYTKQEVIEEVSSRGIFSVAELKKYQNLSSEKNFNDSFNALIKSPEHAPFYFILARFWWQLFGSSVAVLRSLSVIFSLLALPCLYWLCWELFRSPLIGGLAVAFFSVSPFFVAYAQEARPYSLWTVTILISSAALLRAIRLDRFSNWLLYTFTLIIGFYTSLLSLPIAFGQGVYLLFTAKFYKNQILKKYLIALIISLIVFSPWIFVILTQWQTLQDNTIWMRKPLNIITSIAIWHYTIQIPFIDIPVEMLLDPIVGIPIFIISSIGLIYPLYFLCRKTHRKQWIFVLTLMFCCPLILIVGDLVSGGQASTAPRYGISFYLGIYLSLSYLLANKIDFIFSRNDRRQSWKIITIILISVGIISCIANLDKSPKYQKTRNLHNLPISSQIDRAKSPIVLAETDETIDIISLSYTLDPKVKIKILPTEKFVAELNRVDRDGDVFIFNPSDTLKDLLAKEPQLKIKEIYKPKLLTPGEISLSLWKTEQK